jgi:hypothetical protein
MQINIDDNNFEGFNQNSKSEFNKLIENISIEIIKESNRLASSNDYLSTQTTITKTSVIEATNFIIKGLGNSKRSKWRYLHIVCYALSILIGVLSNGLEDKTLGGLLLYIGLIVADIGLATLIITKEI